MAAPSRSAAHLRAACCTQLILTVHTVQHVLQARHRCCIDYVDMVPS